MKQSNGFHVLTNGRRRIAVLAVTAMAVMGTFVGPTLAATAAPLSPESALACTDSAYTAWSATIYNQVVDLRMSGTCGGTTWFRINNNGIAPNGSGTVLIQYKNAAGTVYNGPSQTLFGVQSYVSPTASGWTNSRIKYTNAAGGQPSFTTAWYPVPLLAFK